tara:strand:+ start:305 stop:640 length:336 start_codon:yes stop_codon:yes gene_type:complete
LNPITRETRDYNTIDDIWQTVKDVVNAHDPKRTLGQELYYLVPLFANPKYVLGEHLFAIINEYHYVKDYNIPLGKTLNKTNAIKLDYFTIIKNELASVIRHEQEKNGKPKS